MKSTFKCKYCGKDNEIEITQALEGQIRAQVVVEEKSKHEAELKAVRESAQEEVAVKIREELEFKIKKSEEEAAGQRERSKKLEDQIGELMKEIRQTRAEKEDIKLELQKKFLAEEEKIREQTRKNLDDEHRLKDAEKEKKLQDALKMNEELRRKLEQGSQQTQGEVLEQEIEEILRREFPADTISEVKKGQRGADIAQEVIDKNGKSCGRILWESKNAKWSQTWIEKLKEDQRQAKADLAVLVATELPEGLDTFVYQNGIWLCSRKLIRALAFALRYDLVRINYERLANIGKNEKTEILFQYITSAEFKHRVEAIVTSFGQMQGEIERERRWFQTKWSRQEKQLRLLIDHTQGMYGDLQGVVGKALPDIQPLQLESGEED